MFKTSQGFPIRQCFIVKIRRCQHIELTVVGVKTHSRTHWVACTRCQAVQFFITPAWQQDLELISTTLMAIRFLSYFSPLSCCHFDKLRLTLRLYTIRGLLVDHMYTASWTLYRNVKCKELIFVNIGLIIKDVIVKYSSAYRLPLVDNILTSIMGQFSYR